MAIEVLQEYVQQFQDQRKLVTDDILEQFMRPRKLQWGGNPNPVSKATMDGK
jgi:tryptophanyl-tRNA synthetase